MSQQFTPTELDKVLSHCMQQMSDGLWGVDECLAHYPDHAAELHDILETVHSLKAISHIAPSPAFRSAAPGRLQARLANSARPPLVSEPAAPPSVNSINGHHSTNGTHVVRPSAARIPLERTAPAPASSSVPLGIALTTMAILAIILMLGAYFNGVGDSGNITEPIVTQEMENVVGPRPSLSNPTTNGEDNPPGDEAGRRGPNSGAADDAADQTSGDDDESESVSVTETPGSNGASVTDTETGEDDANEEEQEDDENEEDTETTDVVDSCSSKVNPVTQMLADEYGIDAGVIQGWRCDGYGFGEITLAINEAEETGSDAADLLTGKDETGGMGQINNPNNNGNSDGNSGNSGSPPDNSNAGGNSDNENPGSENNNAGGNSGNENSNAGGNSDNENSGSENNNAGGNSGNENSNAGGNSGDAGSPPENSNAGGNSGDAGSPPENSNAGGNDNKK